MRTKIDSPTRRWRRSGHMGLAVLLAATAIGCGDSDTSGPPVAAVAAVAIAPADGAWTGSLRVGQTISLRARALDAAGREVSGQAVAWSSQDTAVAQVSPTGVVAARGAGTTTVSATIRGRAGMALVVVAPAEPPPAEVAIVQVTPAAGVLQVGSTRQYRARAFDANGMELMDRPVLWSADPGGVVEIGATGLLRALGPGYAQVTATVGGRTGSVALTVVAPPPPEPVHGVIITPGHTAVLRTQYVQLKAITIARTGGTLPGRAVTWESLDPHIALVGTDGLVLGVERGTARIRATSEGVSREALVEVRVMPTEPVHTYRLVGTQTLPVPYVDIGRTAWTDSTGTVRDAFYLVRGGTLTLDLQHQRYSQSIVVHTMLVNGAPDQAPVAVQHVQDEGVLRYDVPSGMPILVSLATPGGQHRAAYHGAGEYLIHQTVLGRPAVGFVWRIE